MYSITPNTIYSPDLNYETHKPIWDHRVNYSMYNNNFLKYDIKL